MSEETVIDARDEAVDLLTKLDRIARDIDHYEYGLPMSESDIDRLVVVLIPVIVERNTLRSALPKGGAT